MSLIWTRVERQHAYSLERIFSLYL
jgi:hypothetical protein